MKRTFVIGFIILFRVLPSVAQLDIQLSQHMLNRLNYNPAVTGATQYVNVTGYMRDQWTGWTGAPRSQVILAHNYFNSINSGFGLSLINDVIGAEKSLNIKISYAYHIRISGFSYLSLGLSGGILHRFFDRSELMPDDITDTDLPLDIGNKTFADFDFGLEFNTSRLTLGASITHLTVSDKHTSPLRSGRHYYAFAKYVLPLASRWEMEPSLFMQQNRRFTHSEVNTLFFYDRRFWFGASYRVDASFRSESFVPMAGMEIAKLFRIGYSFDMNLGDLKNFSGGTHEILLSLRIGKNTDRHFKSPRFFE